MSARVQKRRRLWTLLSGLMSGMGASASYGAVFQGALTSGVMQQPTSSYYHVIYGAQVDLSSKSDGLILRGSYFERPAFKSVGYTDKDYGWSGLLGSKLAGQKNHVFLAFFGGARVFGYVKAVSPSEEGVSRDRSFHLPGITAAMEYRWQGERFFLGAGHQAIIGIGDSAQTDAFVAWPFSLFTLSFGGGW